MLKSGFTKFARFVLRVYTFICYRVEVVNPDKYSYGSKLICSNHVNASDPVILAAKLPEIPRFMGKEQLFNKPILGWILTTCGGLPVARDGQGSDIKVLKTSLRILKNKESLLLFPEGTRNRGKEPLEVKAGIAMMAIKAKVPVMPISIEYTKKIFGKVRVEFGDLIELDEYYGQKLTSDEYQAVAQKIIDDVYKMKKWEVQ